MLQELRPPNFWSQLRKNKKKFSPHNYICMSSRISAVVFLRQWYHIRGSSSHRTRQSTQTSQKGTDILHCWTASGQTHVGHTKTLFLIQFAANLAYLNTNPVFNGLVIKQISATSDFMLMFVSLCRSCRLNSPRTTIQMPKRYRN